MPVKIFFCYAHEDEALLNQLKTHLRPLQRQGLIEMWHDREIRVGTEWQQEINQHLNTAQIILLLVSPDFMASDYCYGIEMRQAMERRERGETRVIPVILRSVSWQGGPFGKLQALPTDGKPVKSWLDPNEALFNVAEGIRRTVEELITEQLRALPSPLNTIAPPPLRPQHRQRNVAIGTTVVMIIVLSIVGSLVSHYRLALGSLSATSNTASPSATFPSPPAPSASTFYANHYGITFDFEHGTQGWISPNKQAIVGMTINPVHSGMGALRITTTLIGSGSSSYHGDALYQHTEAQVDLGQGIPTGFSRRGPYNLGGKRISCYVYAPQSLAQPGTNVQLYLFVKDWLGQFDIEDPVTLNSTNIGQWIPLTLDVGVDPKEYDHGFDQSRIAILGVRIQAPRGSTLDYRGSWYIDDCAIQH